MSRSASHPGSPTAVPKEIVTSTTQYVAVKQPAGATNVHLPKLDKRGQNWVGYSREIKSHITSRRLKPYLDGSMPAPARIEAAESISTTPGVSASQSPFARWEEKDEAVRTILYQTLRNHQFLLELISYRTCWRFAAPMMKIPETKSTRSRG